MADVNSDSISSNYIEIEAASELALGENVESGKDEENLLVTDENNIDTHDEKLSTIPEETDSLAGKVDNVDSEEVRASVSIGATIPVNGDSVSSVKGQVALVTEEDVQDTSSDHASYIEKYKNLMMELTVVKHRNTLLQKKVMEHLKRRKLMDSKTEVVADLDLEVKYLKQLQEFKQIKDQLTEEEHQRDQELEELRKQTVELKDSVKVKISEMVTNINSAAEKIQLVKGAKTQHKEMVERLTGRLVSKLGELSKMQLEHIKLRNRVTALQDRKKELEVGGGVLHLANYEQLRTENQNLLGKVEDRDEELQRLREKAMTSVHNLAHIRQKSWAVEQALTDKSSQLQTLEEQFAKMREEMNNLKKQKEYYRSETRKLRQTAGLILEPALLRDYEQSADEVAHLSAELQNLRNSYYDNQRKLTNMRKMMQLARQPDHSVSLQCGVQISVPCQPCIRRK